MAITATALQVIWGTNNNPLFTWMMAFFKAIPTQPLHGFYIYNSASQNNHVRINVLYTKQSCSFHCNIGTCNIIFTRVIIHFSKFKNEDNDCHLNLQSHAYNRQTAAPSPVRSQVDTADAQVVTTANKTRLQFQGPPVGCHRLLWAASIGKGGTQLVPQQVVLPEVRSKAKIWPTSRTWSIRIQSVWY